MKQFLKTFSLLILLTFIFQLINAKAIFQISYQDTTLSNTVKFFRGLVKNQTKYQGQPFSVLLAELPYKIKWYGPLPGEKLSDCLGIILSFYDTKHPFGNQNYNKIAILNVIWKTPVASSEIQKLTINNTYGWGDAEKNYFSPLVVDTIMITMPDPNIKN